MIEVVIERDTDGNIRSISADGHAGYDIEGKDIVCAAVAVLLETAVLGLEKYLGEGNLDIDAEQGYMKIRTLPPAVKAEGEAVLETAVLGLKEIQKRYRKHLTIKEEGGKR